MIRKSTTRSTRFSSHWVANEFSCAVVIIRVHEDKAIMPCSRRSTAQSTRDEVSLDYDLLSQPAIHVKHNHTGSHLGVMLAKQLTNPPRRC